MPNCLKHNEPAIAVAGAMSKQRGFICYTVVQKALKSKDFMDFLTLLKSKSPKPFLLLLDNASIHKSYKVYEWCK